jgi:hypothetical protein
MGETDQFPARRIVAWIMGLDRAIRHVQQGSVYDDPEHGLWVF